MLVWVLEPVVLTVVVSVVVNDVDPETDSVVVAVDVIVVTSQSLKSPSLNSLNAKFNEVASFSHTSASPIR